MDCHNDAVHTFLWVHTHALKSMTSYELRDACPFRLLCFHSRSRRCIQSITSNSQFCLPWTKISPETCISVCTSCLGFGSFMLPSGISRIELQSCPHAPSTPIT